MLNTRLSSIHVAHDAGLTKLGEAFIQPEAFLEARFT